MDKLAIVLSVLSFVTSLWAVLTIVLKIVRWVDRQNKFESEIIKIEREQSLTMRGVLVCLKTISSTTKDKTDIDNAISDIESYMNEQAHQTPFN